jgi:branched-chain amino acid transport system ATP-binding protein
MAAEVLAGTALEVEAVSKDFGGLRVLTDVSVRLQRGEKVTVIGPNGAGKTTLFNIVSGLLRPSAGHVWLFGRDVTHLPAHRRGRLGLGRGFQITNLFPELTVHHTAMLTAIRRSSRDYDCLRPFRVAGDAALAAEAGLVRWGFAGRMSARVRELSYGEQRRLDICLALMMEPSVLLLDEPTAGLSALESTEVVGIVRSLPRELACLVVTHDLRFGFEIADRVVALHQGRVVIEGSPGEVQADHVLRAMYF